MIERTKTDIRIFGEPWTDDGVLCMNVDFLEEGKRTARELLWCGWEGVAAAKYANDSDKAYRDFEETLKANDEMNKTSLSIITPKEEANG